MTLLKQFAFYAIIIFAVCLIFNANAASYNQQQATTGLKKLLDQAAHTAISQLSTKGGFSQNKAIKIELPGNLGKASRMLKAIGLGNQLNQLENDMNTAAEAAIPEAQQMLLRSIQQMTFKDAKAIITGSDKAATAYLEKTNRSQLFNKFLPKVKTITSKTSLASNYNALITKASALGLANNKMNIENYVTNKALDGLFKTIGEQESYLRNNPTKVASEVFKKIFNSIKQ